MGLFQLFECRGQIRLVHCCGLFAGLAIAASAWLQGKAGAGGSHALAETGKGFTNYLAALGIIETVAIFVMVLSILLT